METSSEVTGPINVGNPAEITMLDLAERVLRLSGSKSELTFKPLPSDDPRQRQPNVSMARSVLGWQPTVSVDDGLKETIRYFRGILIDA
jgi:UDP-glucuronate decarboxylase